MPGSETIPILNKWKKITIIKVHSDTDIDSLYERDNKGSVSLIHLYT